MIKKLILYFQIPIILLIIFINIMWLPFYLMFILLFLEIYFYKTSKINFVSIKKITNYFKSKKCKYKVEEVKIKTFDGSGELTHPSIIKFEKKYILVYTPYKNCNIELENPSICISHNLNTFEDVKENLNPLLPIIRHSKDSKVNKYYNDSFVYSENDIVKIIYRYTEQSEKNIKNRLFQISSNDLQNWSVPEKIFDDDDSYMSSSLVKYRNKKYLFYFDYDNVLCYKIQNHKNNWSSKNKIIIPNIIPWHGEVKIVDDKFILLFVDKKFDLYFAEIDINSNKCTFVKKLHIYYDIKENYKNVIKYKSTFIIDNNQLILFVPFRYDKINLFKKRRVNRKWIITKTVIPLNDVK